MAKSIAPKRARLIEAEEELSKQQGNLSEKEEKLEIFNKEYKMIQDDLSEKRSKFSDMQRIGSFKRVLQFLIYFSSKPRLQSKITPL